MLVTVAPTNKRSVVQRALLKRFVKRFLADRLSEARTKFVGGLDKRYGTIGSRAVQFVALRIRSVGATMDALHLVFLLIEQV